jgi:hypothetical protein
MQQEKFNIQLATHVKFLNGTTKSCKTVVNVIYFIQDQDLPPILETLEKMARSWGKT